MKNSWLIVPLLCVPSLLFGQNDTLRIMRTSDEPNRTEVKEQRYEMEDTEELKKTPDSLSRVEITTIHYFIIGYNTIFNIMKLKSI